MVWILYQSGFRECFGRLRYNHCSNNFDLLFKSFEAFRKKKWHPREHQNRNFYPKIDFHAIVKPVNYFEIFYDVILKIMFAEISWNLIKHLQNFKCKNYY